MNNDSKIKLINLDFYIAIIPLVVLIFVTFFGVIMRYILKNPLGWIEEIQLFSIVWIIFLGGSYAFRTGNHVAIEILYDACPDKFKRFLDIFNFIISLFTLLVLFYASIKFLSLYFLTGRSTSILGIPYKWIYIVIPVSCLLQIINYGMVEYKNIKSLKEGGKDE